MLTGLTARQFIGWWRYFQLEPFGELRADMRIGALLASYMTVNRNDEHHPEAFTAIEVMPFLRAEFGETTVEAGLPTLADEAGWSIFTGAIVGDTKPSTKG